MHLSLKLSRKPFTTGPCIQVPTRTAKSGILRQSRSQKHGLRTTAACLSTCGTFPWPHGSLGELRASVPVRPLVASLQEHVQRVLHPLLQLRRAARHQQCGQPEGGGEPVLVDVGEQVLLVLAADDDLRVVVVEIHLGEETKT